MTTDINVNEPVQAGQVRPVSVATETAAPAPADPTPDTDAGVDLDNMTEARIAQLEQQIAERRANRPPSVAEELEALRKQIAGTADQQGQAAAKRREGRDEADELGRTLAKLQTAMRRMELKEAAEAANFRHPDKVIEFLAPQVGEESNLAELVAAAAASGVFVMNTPQPSAQIGGPGTKNAPPMDPGRAALMAEIREAQGR